MVVYIMNNGFGLFALKAVTLLGIAVGIIAFAFGIFYLIHKFFHSDTWEATKGMAYSFKNKVCPAINWKGNEEIEAEHQTA